MKTIPAMAVATIVALTLASSGMARADIISNLENHYSFDNSSNPTNDDSGNLRHGTNYGASWVNDPMLGGVMDFGTSDYILADIPNLNTAGKFTIALWANIPVIAGNRGLFQAQYGGTTPGGTKVIGGWVNPATISGRIIDTAGLKDLSAGGPPKLDTGTWTHIVYRGDGTSGTYERIVNGASSGPTVSFNGTLAAHDRILIGIQGSESAIGMIDDFRVYSRALTDTEISELIVPQDQLNVDFGNVDGTGGGPNGALLGFVAFEAVEGGGNPDQTRTYATSLGSGGTVDVKVGGYTHFRDYVAVSSGPFAAYSPLLSDNVLRDSSGTMTLTLDGLKDGLYDVTTYHHTTPYSSGKIYNVTEKYHNIKVTEVSVHQGHL